MSIIRPGYLPTPRPAIPVGIEIKRSPPLAPLLLTLLPCSTARQARKPPTYTFKIPLLYSRKPPNRFNNSIHLSISMYSHSRDGLPEYPSPDAPRPPAHHTPPTQYIDPQLDAATTAAASACPVSRGVTPVPLLEQLRRLPELRAMPWKPGYELPPERSTESPRVQQRGASLLATRGRVAERACDQCAAGHGRFMYCVTLGHWFQGGCSTCIFTSKGNKCSLRIQNTGRARLLNPESSYG